MRLFQGLTAAICLVGGLLVVALTSHEALGVGGILMSYLWTISDDIDQLKIKLGG